MAKKNEHQRHYHYHGSHASVPVKGNGPVISQDHWEMQYDPTPRGQAKVQGARNWDPMPGKDRPHTQNKINECDH